MIIIGSGLKRREKLSGRLADILSNLYLVSAVIKQFEERGRPAEELPLLEWACADSFRAIKTAFEGFLANFPSRPAALLLRLAAFPLGIPDIGPGDRLGHRVAAILLSPSAARGGKVSPSAAPPAGTGATIAARTEAEYYARIASIGIPTNPDHVITAEEANIVAVAQAARQEVIRVDDFPADYWGKGGGRE